MYDHVIVFVTGYVSVFAAGFQSRNVNTGNYKGAALTSAFIGVTSAFLWTHTPATLIGGLTYGLAGALAITSSMFVHERFMRDRTTKS